VRRVAAVLQVEIFESQIDGVSRKG
jgi:hypothetical protein